MSFMYNPFPFDDPKPINRPKLSEKTINSIVTGGTPNVAKKFVAEIADRVKAEGVIVGIDGYTTANWNLFVNLLATYSHGIFKPVVPVKELWEQVLRIGATQHYAIVDGDWRKELEDFAEIMGFEFYNIK